MSLADRITSPAAIDTKAAPEPASGTQATSVDTKKSWADELASPTGSTPVGGEGSNLLDAQLDGGAMFNGSGFEEADYEVELNLDQIQQDQSADNPLFGGNKGFPDLIQCVASFCTSA